MLNPDNWNRRSVRIMFINESAVGDEGNMTTRKFNHISKGADEHQLLQLGKAISKVTPNGADGDVEADVDDHFVVFDV